MWKGNLALTRTIHITYWCNEHHPSFISYLCNKIPPKRGNIVILVTCVIKSHLSLISFYLCSEIPSILEAEHH